MLRTINIIKLLFVFVLFGCEKDKDSLPSGVYLKEVVYHQNADQVRYYHYSNTGQLSSREFRFNNIIAERFDYQYKNGFVNRIDYYSTKSNLDHTLLLKSSTTYEYDSGKIVRSTLSPDNVDVKYEYDTHDRIIRSSSPSSSTLYEYDNFGNIKKATLHLNGQEFGAYYYEYDTKKNPFFNIEPINEKFSEIDLISYKCPNNLIKEIFIKPGLDTISSSTFRYKYNHHDLPIESYELFTSKSNGYDQDSMNLKLFEYEIKN